MSYESSPSGPRGVPSSEHGRQHEGADERAARQSPSGPAAGSGTSRTHWEYGARRMKDAYEASRRWDHGDSGVRQFHNHRWNDRPSHRGGRTHRGTRGGRHGGHHGAIDPMFSRGGGGADSQPGAPSRPQGKDHSAVPGWTSRRSPEMPYQPVVVAQPGGGAPVVVPGAPVGWPIYIPTTPGPDTSVAPQPTVQYVVLASNAYPAFHGQWSGSTAPPAPPAGASSPGHAQQATRATAAPPCASSPSSAPPPPGVTHPAPPPPPSSAPLSAPPRRPTAISAAMPALDPVPPVPSPPARAGPISALSAGRQSGTSSPRSHRGRSSLPREAPAPPLRRHQQISAPFAAGRGMAAQQVPRWIASETGSPMMEETRPKRMVPPPPPPPPASSGGSAGPTMYRAAVQQEVDAMPALKKYRDMPQVDSDAIRGCVLTLGDGTSAWGPDNVRAHQHPRHAPVFALDVECVATGKTHNDRSVGQVTHRLAWPSRPYYVMKRPEVSWAGLGP